MDPKDPDPERTRRILERKENLRKLVERFLVMDIEDFMSAVTSSHNG